MIAVLDVSGAIQVLLKNGKRPKFDEEIKKYFQFSDSP